MFLLDLLLHFSFYLHDMLKQLLKREVLLLKPVKKNILSNVKCSQLSNGEFRILFIGSDSLVSLPVLKFLHEEYRKITKTHSSISLNVLTRVLEKNLNPVAEYCLDNGLEIRNWDHLEESDGFASLKCDVGVLSSFGKLVPGELIDASKVRIVLPSSTKYLLNNYDEKYNNNIFIYKPEKYNQR